MTTTTHKRSVHIEASVEKVFEHVEDPRHFYDAMTGSEHGHDMMSDLQMTTQGVGSTYRWKTSMFGIPVKGLVTREQYSPNERIVDHSSTGPVWTWTFSPDPEGTTVTLGYEYSTKVPLMDKVIDHIVWHGDGDLDRMLSFMKRAIEA